jgi:deoxyribodipyrimidine photo-lyase
MIIHPDRLQVLADGPEKPEARYVLYWMQQAQRESANHALEFSLLQANRLGLPLVVLFGLTDSFPEANERHYAFLLQGLADAQRAIQARGIKMVVSYQPPVEAAARYAKEAALVVCDRGYLKVQRKWRAEVAQRVSGEVGVRVVQVESDVVVPVEVASDKEEFAARTLRPKVSRHIATYLTPLDRVPVKHPSLGLTINDPHALDLTDINRALAKLKIDRRVGQVTTYLGGQTQAHKFLKDFVRQKLAHYAELRNEPDKDYVSHMSPYLHFGNISPLEIALAVQEAAGSPNVPKEAIESYIEELVVRRELSMNFILHNERYDTYDCLPDWAKTTLADHAQDKRPYLYSARELEEARTHDPYWNAAQMEMVLTGKMHNYMRMYWGKKIIEWTHSPQEAFSIALRLNNTYQLDGRDGNSFTGVAWCFGKHDRPWTRRPIFGTVRYMNAAGLERKFDIQKYVMKIDSLTPKDRPVAAIYG